MGTNICKLKQALWFQMISCLCFKYSTASVPLFGVLFAVLADVVPKNSDYCCFNRSDQERFKLMLLLIPMLKHMLLNKLIQRNRVEGIKVSCRYCIIWKWCYWLTAACQIFWLSGGCVFCLMSRNYGLKSSPGFIRNISSSPYNSIVTVNSAVLFFSNRTITQALASVIPSDLHSPDVSEFYNSTWKRSRSF